MKPLLLTGQDIRIPITIEADLVSLINDLNERLELSEDKLFRLLLRSGIQGEILRIKWHEGLQLLSPRIRQVASLALEKETIKEVAEEMGISPHTAQGYAEKACSAMHCRNRTELRVTYGFLKYIGTNVNV